MMTVFSGHDLACVRGQNLVFEGISFTVEGGQTLALTGPNGSGKTSLLRMMAGLLAPFAGTISPRPGLHWLGPENALKENLTVRENLAFFLALVPAPSLTPSPLARSAASPPSLAEGGGIKGGGREIAAALEKSNIAHLADMPVRALSVGQRRRVALARLFLADRPLWLLDEPASGLDEKSAKDLATLVKAHIAAGGMTVIATHEPDFWSPDKTLRFAA